VQKIPEIAPSAAAFGLGVGFTAVLCWMPFFLSQPNFYGQFLRHSQVIVFSMSDWSRLLARVSLAWEVAPHRLFILFATVPILCLGMVTFWRAGRIGETIALFVAPVVGFGLLMFVLTSDRKTRANRVNAQASTGPKTARGRARGWPGSK
jgi:uncharacterized protein (DUF1697 family)